MTFVGKILTVLLMVMSLVFAAMALMVTASVKNWKDTAIQLEKDKAKLETEKSTLQSQKIDFQNKLQKETRARQTEVAALHTTAEQLEKDLAAKEASLAQRDEAFQKMQTDFEQASARAAELVGITEKLQDEIVKAIEARNAKLQTVTLLTDQKNGLEGTLRLLQDRHDQLAVRITRMKTVMDRIGVTENTPIENITPEVDGYVTQVSAKNPDLIEISIGQEDSVRPGHKIHVLRGKTYLGRAIVIKTSAQRSVAEFENRLKPIQKNDFVTTKLN